MRSVLHVEGMQHLMHQLGSVIPREAMNVLRRTVTRQSAALRDEVRRAAPVRSGTLKRAIKSRRQRGDRGTAEASVYIEKGAGAKHDAWYWHFLEFGTKFRPAKPFITPAFEAFREKFREAFEGEFMTQLERSIAKGGAAAGGGTSGGDGEGAEP